MKYQFISLEKGKSGPKRETFMEAWNDMYLYVKALLDADQMNYQVLETCIWIECSNNQPPMFFYDARDKAINEGWQQPK